MMMAERMPRLVVPKEDVHSRYVRVLCTGLRRNGYTCNRPLGDLNINHPYDVRYVCRDCGSEYVLQKS
jgi:hypothetical protein